MLHEPGPLLQSDNCNYYIRFPTYNWTSCSLPNRVDFFEPTKTNNRVSTVEYAILVNDIREDTENSITCHRILCALLTCLLVMTIGIITQIKTISGLQQLIGCASSLILYGLLLILTSLLMRKAYKRTVVRVLNEHNRERYHRRNLHWNTVFEDRGWLHLQLNFNSATSEFLPMSEISETASASWVLNFESSAEERAASFGIIKPNAISKPLLEKK